MRKKLVSLLLALVMVLSLVPVTAFAAEGDTSSDNDALHLAKTTTLQSDGTYTIELEAYATGSVTTSTESIPCDIVLLLDQSGSMSDVLGTQTSGNFVEASFWLLIIPVNVNKVSTANLVQGLMTLYVKNSDGTYSAVNISESNGTYTVTKQETGEVVYTGVDKDMQFYRYQTSSTETSKQEGLMAAAKAFIEATGDKNDAITDADQKHRIAIVKFAGTETDTVGNDKYNDSGYEYNYTQIVQNLTSDEGTLLTQLNSLSEAGATSADYGMNRAAAALGDLSTDDGRKKIIIMFTDGEPNHGNGFSDSVAAATVNKAKELKDENVIIYTIGVLSGANPALDPTLSSTSDVNKYLHAVSSNYPTASATDSFVVTWGETGSYTNGFYKTATTSSELTSIFQEIQNSVGSTTITLDETAVMKDIVTDNFILPEGFTAAGNVKVETVDYAGSGAFNKDTRAPLSSAVVAINGRTVDVKGFDYAENYCVDGSGTVATSGKKLCVTISGVELNPDQFADGVVNTNAATSGIYDGDGNEAVLVEAFDVPTVKLASKSYVIDYAKSFTMDASEWGIQTLNHMGLTPAKFTSSNTGGLDLINGVLNNLTYTPQTMSWNGYDTFYGFGVPNNDLKDADNPYIWSKVNVIPANNVYYEDTFKDTTATEGTAGTVGIVYSDNVTVGTAGSNTETPNNSVMGWIVSMSKDTTDSDGTATEMKVPETGATATATFTFTGTGVDIYSRTDMKSGIIVGALYQGDNTVASKTLMVDTLAVSAGDGSYYNIPTLSFSGLEHGEYKVKLTVTRGRAVQMEDGEPVVDDDGNLVYSDTEKRSTYYLDGIRIYNPVQNIENTDDTVKDAYTEEDAQGNITSTELNAVFAEVRDLMAKDTASDSGQGTVFIDLDGNGVVADKGAYDTTEYGTYGPKNEVYLAEGQSITFKVDGTSSNFYQVGLKAPEGTATTAAFSKDAETNSGTTINHSTDLYYKVTPVDGYITIKNTGAGLLSVTKIKMTGTEASGIALLSVTADEASAEIAAFSLRSVAAYDAAPEEEVPEVPETPEEPEEPVTPEEPVQPETPKEPETPDEPQEPEEPTEPEVPDIDIEIENPEPEEKPVQKPDHHENLKKLVNSLFKMMSGWFGR